MPLSKALTTAAVVDNNEVGKYDLVPVIKVSLMQKNSFNIM